jgi:hypothetical protein
MKAFHATARQGIWRLPRSGYKQLRADRVGLELDPPSGGTRTIRSMKVAQGSSSGRCPNSKKIIARFLRVGAALSSLYDERLEFCTTNFARPSPPAILNVL